MVYLIVTQDNLFKEGGTFNRMLWMFRQVLWLLKSVELFLMLPVALLSGFLSPEKDDPRSGFVCLVVLLDTVCVSL